MTTDMPTGKMKFSGLHGQTTLLKQGIQNRHLYEIT